MEVCLGGLVPWIHGRKAWAHDEGLWAHEPMGPWFGVMGGPACALGPLYGRACVFYLGYVLLTH